MVISFETYVLSFTIFFLNSSPCVQSLIPHLKATKESFTIDIIHRDSMKSPLFDSKKTHFQRTYDALLRSEKRVKYLFHKNTSTINIDFILHNRGMGEYIMQYSLGHPMYTTYGFIDTGSSFSWVQCQLAISSYDQGFLPFLNTNIDRGLTPIPCNNIKCITVVRESVTHQDIDYNNCQCMYLMAYADGAATAGHVFHTLLRLQTRNGDYIGFQRFIFGCSREVNSFPPIEASGILAFGRVSGSVISQISDRIGGIFGHCLVPIENPNIYSQMKFGQSAIVYGPDVIYTPMLSRAGASRLYWINLQAISVGNRRIQYILEGEMGNMLLDSGIVSNYLPFGFYSEFEAVIEAELDLLYQRTPDPDQFFNLCYLQNSIEEMGGPIITLHLRGGDLVLSVENTYAMVDDGVVCLNFIGEGDDAVLGVMGQANFMVTYHLQDEMISFKKMNCAVRN